MNKRPIGIFDSGVGGLTVFKRLAKDCPGENIVYLGDTAHLPYGDKSLQTVKRLSLENSLFLVEQKVKMIVVACNTSSSIALEYLRTFFKIPVLGVIESQVKSALNSTKNGRIGVIGTRSTVKSMAYEKKIKRANRKVKVYSVSCPLFVPLVEEGLSSHPLAERVINMYLGKLRKANIDTLILACTHYPLLKSGIQRFFKKKVKMIDASLSIVDDVQDTLRSLQIEGFARSRRPSYKFFVTDDLDGFLRKSRVILGKDIKKNINLSKVTL